MKEPDFPGGQYKKKNMSQLNHDDKRAIVVGVIVNKEKHDDIARRHRVSKPLVSSLVARATKNKTFLDELLATEMEQSAKDNGIIETIEKMMLERKPIVSSKYVQNEMVEDGLEPAKTKDICRVLSKDYKMTHRRVHKI